MSGSKSVLKPESEMVSQEKYDNYLTKLQNICTEQGEEGGHGGHGQPPVSSVSGASKPVYETLKTAIHTLPSPMPAAQT